MLLLNAFSANMLAEFPCTVQFAVLDGPAAVRDLIRDDDTGIQSAVGHADTAAVFSAVLGLSVACERRTVTLTPGDDAIVGQYIGPRLPEGCTALPDGATIKWLHLYLPVDDSTGGV